MRISVDGSRIRNNKVAFSNLSDIVWTGPQPQINFSQVSYRVIAYYIVTILSCLCYNLDRQKVFG